MREIKFRAWDEYRKDMGQVYFMNDTGADTWEVDYEGNTGEPKTGLVIEQFTGLKDKNGVEIYEGDIVKSPHHNPDKYVIEFAEGGFCAVWYELDYPIDINHFFPSTGCQIEVLGNIHQNPELLK